MLQKDREFLHPLLLALEENPAGERPEEDEVVMARPDFWLCILRGERAARLRCESAGPVLVLCFGMPRTIGEGVLPDGMFYVQPPGRHVLPDVPPRGLVLCMTKSRLLAILAEDAVTLPEEIRTALAARERAAPRPVPLAPEQVLAGNASCAAPMKGRCGIC